MTNLLKKFRISAELDNGGHRGSGPVGSGELVEFEQRLKALDQALQAGAPVCPEMPRSLHYSIMNAIRATEASITPRPAGMGLVWVAAPALALLVVLSTVWLASHQESPPVPASESVNAALSSLQRGGDIARTMPSIVLAPMARELDSVNQDVEQTANFLMASLP